MNQLLAAEDALNKKRKEGVSTEDLQAQWAIYEKGLW